MFKPPLPGRCLEPRLPAAPMACATPRRLLTQAYTFPWVNNGYAGNKNAALVDQSNNING